MYLKNYPLTFYQQIIGMNSAKLFLLSKTFEESIAGSLSITNVIIPPYPWLTFFTHQRFELLGNGCGEKAMMG